MWKRLFSKCLDVGGRQADAAPRPAGCGPHCPESALSPDTETKHALLRAATRGDLARVEALLKTGVDLEGRDCGGKTALMLAAQGGQAAVVHALLVAGADLDARDTRNWSALMIAAQEGQPSIVQALADAGVGVAAQR